MVNDLVHFEHSERSSISSSYFAVNGREKTDLCLREIVFFKLNWAAEDYFSICAKFSRSSRHYLFEELWKIVFKVRFYWFFRIRKILEPDHLAKLLPILQQQICTRNYNSQESRKLYQVDLRMEYRHLCSQLRKNLSAVSLIVLLHTLVVFILVMSE